MAWWGLGFLDVGRRGGEVGLKGIDGGWNKEGIIGLIRI